MFPGGGSEQSPVLGARRGAVPALCVCKHLWGQTQPRKHPNLKAEQDGGEDRRTDHSCLAKGAESRGVGGQGPSGSQSCPFSCASFTENLGRSPVWMEPCLAVS